ncbi:NAD(P)-dependent dehydrogenase (short-subunit alcohol dehydrogenase family) [Sphingobium sp. B11D3B]|uniref:SDR family NAD(P)-dependent oxidoreductase n=1 Tax=Sphingobium sp. B11D3B TaxID=2940575 RepID=UPI0022274D1E|nr:SDR family NAD(P)-dependent oxidoreductase [Sphingobium sp. B11D3B]MCW2387299.1 NAD(P)-dependent dehydrogenase (short-subunit alcohol dehydrogenase family) [Sphingobium sp. B11D3B]
MSVTSHAQTLSGKTALITGVAGNIGHATAREMAARGARIIGIDHPEADASAIQQSFAADPSFALIRADVSREADVKAYVEAARALAPSIDIFFNNAGIEGPQAAITDYPTAAFSRIFEVNVLGVFLGLKYVLPEMQRQKSGAIINTSSIAGLVGAANMSGYIMSKHAVLGLSRTAALEAAPFGVRVNSVHPGFIESRMLTDIVHRLGAPDTDAFSATVPLKRLGSVDEIAKAVAFLASDESSYMTGHAMVLDGGLTVG